MPAHHLIYGNMCLECNKLKNSLCGRTLKNWLIQSSKSEGKQKGRGISPLSKGWIYRTSMCLPFWIQQWLNPGLFNFEPMCYCSSLIVQLSILEIISARFATIFALWLLSSRFWSLHSLHESFVWMLRILVSLSIFYIWYLKKNKHLRKLYFVKQIFFWKLQSNWYI